MDAQGFTIKEKDFIGPIELLYELVEKRKLLIHDISLAKVADDFIVYIKSLELFPTGETASFLSVASTLLLIKSRSLLPGLTLTGDEEEDARTLQKRLALYARMRELTRHVRTAWGMNPLFSPLPPKSQTVVFAPPPGLTLSKVREAFERVIFAIPKHEKKDKATVQKVISLEEMISSLGERLQKAMNTSFSTIVKEHGGKKKGTHHHVTRDVKKNLIVTFLALLELVKRGVVDLMQENPGDDILVESRSLGTPTYGNS